MDLRQRGSGGTDHSFPSLHDSQVPERRAKICEALRAALPRYDDILSICTKNGDWWNSFRYKTQTITRHMLPEALTDFARRTYTTTNPAELGSLAVAYARSSGQSQSHHLYELVYSLILSEFTLAGTMEGMECLVLLAKSYTDIGQPKRAWLVWRKGITLALLMGLHKTGGDSDAQQRIWWAVYHGDRFTSLLLGLPHSFNDSFHSVDSLSPLHFVHQCAVMAGKVIERNSSPAKPSFANAMLLDEQMHEIRRIMPEEWWKIPDQIPSSAADLDDLRERLILHFFFYHIVLYIHLPFLVRHKESLFDASRASCMMAAKQMLIRYRLLRAKVDGASLFDCKTTDFVAFMAAVVIYVAFSGVDCRQIIDHETLDLVIDTEEIFRREEEEHGCKLAARCLLTLLVLSNRERRGSTDSIEIEIPYFGVVVRRHYASQFGGVMPQRGNAPAILPRLLETSTLPNLTPDTPHGEQPMLEYMVRDTASCATQGMLYGPDTGVFPADDLSAWIDMNILNMEEDWGRFSGAQSTI